jgi:ribosomal protein L11 methyltransferase
MAEPYWSVSFELPEAAARAAQEAFDGLAMSVSGFEIDEKSKRWGFDLLCAAPPDMEEIQRRLLVLGKLCGVAAPRAQVKPFAQQDWLARVARDFPPLRLSGFYIHGAHVKEAPPTGLIPIRVEAGCAFGSGEHATTQGCLEAMAWLARKREFHRVLDMGCGSGILAIAAAKLWRADALAADIDPVAVEVARGNFRVNRVRADAVVSNGYDDARVARAAPFDLILSNILARPLAAFAPMLKSHLAKGGCAVLSGLLDSQEAYVRGAHAAQGLRLRQRFVHDGWATLVLQ